MMKKFTLNDIKEFCKAHYYDYLGEAKVVIMFSFLDQGVRRTTTFIDLVEGKGSDVRGTFEYIGYGVLGENKHVFNFKRIA